MFKVDTRELKRMERDLKAFAHRAYPFATRNTLTGAAFKAQKIARADISNSMVSRNRFTAQSVQVDKARSLVVSRQEAIVGSIADYMEVQEFGGTKTKTGKEGVAIATSYSAGQGEGQAPRTRLPRKANKFGSFRLRGGSKRGATRKQQNIAAIKQAAGSGNKFIFLDLGRTKGIFKVTGGKRRSKIKMVHDLSRNSVRIPKNPWLAPSVRKAEAGLPALYFDSLSFQLKRLGLFR